MIRFECRVCQSALWLAEVGTWLCGEPFCNAACSAQIDEAMLRQKTPSVAEHLQALPKLIGDAGMYVRQVSDYVSSLVQSEQGVSTAGRVAGIAAVPFVGLVGAVAVGAVVRAAANADVKSGVPDPNGVLTDQFAHLGMLMKDVVRRSMALQQAGYPMAPTLVAAVQNTDRLDPDDPWNANELLLQVFADLEQAYRLTLTWSAAHG